ncbi:MAG TPA: hypothetical protein DIW27_08435 [Cytophagales bacterium]|nr:hypothetical protein [Cytophagales bacterium]
MAEIVIVGSQVHKIAKQVRSNYLPYSILMGAETQSDLPLIDGKVNPPGKEVTLFVCFNKTCQLPVHSVDEALKQIPRP